MDHFKGIIKDIKSGAWSDTFLSQSYTPKDPTLNPVQMNTVVVKFYDHKASNSNEPVSCTYLFCLAVSLQASRLESEILTGITRSWSGKYSRPKRFSPKIFSRWWWMGFVSIFDMYAFPSEIAYKTHSNHACRTAAISKSVIYLNWKMFFSTTLKNSSSLNSDLSGKATRATRQINQRIVKRAGFQRLAPSSATLLLKTILPSGLTQNSSRKIIKVISKFQSLIVLQEG